jgi:hypothetical protein
MELISWKRFGFFEVGFVFSSKRIDIEEDDRDGFNFGRRLICGCIWSDLEGRETSSWECANSRQRGYFV